MVKQLSILSLHSNTFTLLFKVIQSWQSFFIGMQSTVFLAFMVINTNKYNCQHLSKFTLHALNACSSTEQYQKDKIFKIHVDMLLNFYVCNFIFWKCQLIEMDISRTESVSDILIKLIEVLELSNLKVFTNKISTLDRHPNAKCTNIYHKAYQIICK